MTDSRSTESNTVQLPPGTMARAIAVALGPSAVLDALCMLATAIVVRRWTGRARGPLNPVVALLTGSWLPFRGCTLACSDRGIAVGEQVPRSSGRHYRLTN